MPGSQGATPRATLSWGHSGDRAGQKRSEGSSQLLGAHWSLLDTDAGCAHKVAFCCGERKRWAEKHTGFLQPSQTKLRPEQSSVPPGPDVPLQTPGDEFRSDTKPCTLNLETAEARLSFPQYLPRVLVEA